MTIEQPPPFFIPGIAADKQEECYTAMAQLAHCAVPEIGKRVYSITYSHDGEVWHAVVGKSMRGSATKVSRSKGRRIERTIPLSNASVTLAIFPGHPYFVWHDLASRMWANPFMAGQPISISYFST